ncbi:MAG: CDP-glycerol glycerophosphotransferase family protein [Erysipelotrichaceae bacterium]|nr:CDP-glycerol glycerophosphotransferase family protein [Erysipelotrichaceae bacterium]
MVLFESFMGRNYSDSPKEIYENMLIDKKFIDYKFVWCFRNPEDKIKIAKLENAILVKYKSADYYKYYCQAKYIVSNSRIDTVIQKKDGQVYIQTWHGTPLKKLGYDIDKGDNALHSKKELCNLYKLDAERYDYLISPSPFCTEKFTSAFNLKENNPNVKIIEIGYPRNDFLVNYTENDVLLIKRKLNINKNKKVILYAPTWRDNQYTNGVGYNFDLPIDFKILKNRLEDDYIFLFRTHYFVADSYDFSEYNGFIYDVSSYDNINDLYVISDILITDYSSVFFDYSILKRPIIFYMYDLKDYQDDLRGFYISLKELPGPIVDNEIDLIDTIKKDFKYDEKYVKFNNKFTPLDDGNASKRAIERCFN